MSEHGQRSTGSISVVIPTRNEAYLVGDLIQRLSAADLAQVIVVDGDSTDRTAAVARAHGATVICAPAGRGLQMDRGAEVATGEILLFLHADTRLPDRFDAPIRNVLARPGVSAGAFRLRIDGPRWPFRCLEALIAWRSRFLQLPYGDQALFMRAATYRRIGGFVHQPVMEDFDLVRRLGREGRIEIAPVAVVTSARRWHRFGFCRTTLLNQICIGSYLLGVDPARIAVWRDRGVVAGGARDGSPKLGSIQRTG